MAVRSLEALVDAAAQDKRRDPYATSSGRSSTGLSMAMEESQLDSLSELKRKFKDVLRAYWRQHKSNHDGEDTDQYDVAHRIATNIFNLYWDKPNYVGLRAEKKEILNYFIKHIQLSKSREGQSSNPLLRVPTSGKPDTRSGSNEPDRIRGPREDELHSSSSRRRSIDTSHALQSRMEHEVGTRAKSESVVHLIPRNADMLRSIREIVPEQQLACSLLIDGVPHHIPEFMVRNEIAQILQAQYGAKCIVSALNIGGPLYHALLTTTEECDALAGQSIRLSFSPVPHILFRAPYTASSLNVNLTGSNGAHQNPKKRRGGDLIEADEALASKKPRLAGPSDTNGHSLDNSSNAMVIHATHNSINNNYFPHEPQAGSSLVPHQQLSAFARPLLPTPDDHFVVERILHQRWVQNKVQYLLQLKGEASCIKVWMFDEDIFAEAESNRKQANLWNAMQTGQFPTEAHLLPEVEQILGAKMVGGQLMFYVKWTNSAIFAMVPSSIINTVAPTKVIQFYEARLSFEPSTSELSSPHFVSSPSSSETVSHNNSMLISSSSSSSNATEKKLSITPALSVPVALV